MLDLELIDLHGILDSFREDMDGLLTLDYFKAGSEIQLR
jgi:hypothetical protein